MLFGDRVRQLADERNMTQMDIVRATGMSISRVNMVYHGKVNDPRLETLILFALAFDVSVSELLDGVHVPQKKKKADKNAEEV